MVASKEGLVSRQDICRLAGPIADHTVIAILETGASITDLEVGVMHARGEGEYDVTGHALSGKAGLVSDILANDGLYAREDGEEG